MLPCSNAEVERVDEQNKNKIRNKLLSETLNELMMIDLNGGESGE